MTQEHPITPPPELMHQWHKEACKDPCNGSTFFESKTLKHIATQAARWGGDQELEACINYFHEYDPSWGEDSELITGLRAARRPKPPSLKEQALQALALLKVDASTHGLGFDSSAIRRALESLPE